MDRFKRQPTSDSSVIGYTVTLSKDDFKNRNLVSYPTERHQLRVYMEDDNTVKYFEISKLLGKLLFEIAEIIEYQEIQKRVKLRIKN